MKRAEHQPEEELRYSTPVYSVSCGGCGTVVRCFPSIVTTPRISQLTGKAHPCVGADYLWAITTRRP